MNRPKQTHTVRLEVSMSHCRYEPMETAQSLGDDTHVVDIYTKSFACVSSCVVEFAQAFFMFAQRCPTKCWGSTATTGSDNTEHAISHGVRHPSASVCDMDAHIGASLNMQRSIVLRGQASAKGWCHARNSERRAKRSAHSERFGLAWPESRRKRGAGKPTSMTHHHNAIHAALMLRSRKMSSMSSRPWFQETLLFCGNQGCLWEKTNKRWKMQWPWLLRVV